MFYRPRKKKEPEEEPWLHFTEGWFDILELRQEFSKLLGSEYKLTGSERRGYHWLAKRPGRHTSWVDSLKNGTQEYSGLCSVYALYEECIVNFQMPELTSGDFDLNETRIVMLLEKLYDYEGLWILAKSIWPKWTAKMWKITKVAYLKNLNALKRHYNISSQQKRKRTQR